MDLIKDLMIVLEASVRVSPLSFSPFSPIARLDAVSMFLRYPNQDAEDVPLRTESDKNSRDLII
jgi:hypothetical protein